MSAYNDSKYIRESVKCILNQTYKDFEFLIIDDGSTDETEEIISSFNDSRINYKKISHTGLAGALNFGLANSTGEIIARIDSDDLSVERRLEVQINFLNKNPGYDVIGSRSVYINERNQILFILKPPAEDEGIKNFLNLHNPLNHSTLLYRKDSIIEGGGYNKSFECYEDFELWFRLRNKLKFKIIPEVLVYTRQRKNSLTKRGSKKNIYAMLYKEASGKAEKAGSKSEKEFWNNILFWIEYFYGEKRAVRKNFQGKSTIKKSIAYLNTFLPEQTFKEINELRLKFRIQSKFESKQQYKEELRNLLN